jgi:hypothetical protein
MVYPCACGLFLYALRNTNSVHHVLSLAELVVMQDHTNRVYMMWSSLCTRGNKARSVLVGRFIVKTVGSDLGEACQKAHRRPTSTWGRAEAIHSYPT